MTFIHYPLQAMGLVDIYQVEVCSLTLSLLSKLKQTDAPNISQLQCISFYLLQAYVTRLEPA